ncbi:MAG: SLC13 family permease [Alphaproteobacteria bacterium]|nr:SLC13 family permease [Alphaproteobacteria bacterium]
MARHRRRLGRHPAGDRRDQARRAAVTVAADRDGPVAVASRRPPRPPLVRRARQRSETLTHDQILCAAILVGVLALLLWGRIRYDVVALIALLAAVAAGIVAPSRAFSGFGHPAVVTVALVLVLSCGLERSGAADLLVHRLLPERLQASRTMVLVTLGAVAALLSAFMNNVGALALLMPAAMRASERSGVAPAALLMPLSFATLLGGMTTLIGTPPNIVIARFRQEVTGQAFAMFDFAPVGLAVAGIGILFVAVLGWRLIPAARRALRPHVDLMDVGPYLAEVRVTERSKAAGKLLQEVEDATEVGEITALIRGDMMVPRPSPWERLAAGDVLVLRADPNDLSKLVRELGLELRGAPGAARGAGQAMAEAVVVRGGLAEELTPRELRLRSRFGISLLGISRRGQSVHARMRSMRLAAGDILLLQGDEQRLPEAIAAIGCLPLAARSIGIAAPRRIGVAVLAFLAAIAATSFGVMEPEIAFAAAALAYLAFGVISLRSAYESIEWPVVVLLGAMIPIGLAVESTGLGAALADHLVGLAGPWRVGALVAVLLVTMALTDVVNNTATAIVMAPVAVGVAKTLAVSPDPFLMAVAIGASCAFNTPIGHQNNALIMGPGGYQAGDFWRMGLPLDLIVVAVAVPLILVVWPL